MLYLDGCLSIQNIPEIECRMEYMESIYLQETAIKELPSSIGYLTQLRDLHLGGCKNLMQLPSSILQLQHLEVLSLENCSKLVKLSRNDQEKRQSILLSVVSTEECETPSASELPLLPSPTNPSLLDHGCSSTVFPKLENLSLKNCVLSASDFLVILNCFSTLESINLSGSKLVSLPTCIKRFVELKILILESCTQLREILELPPNIEEVYASECMSLESFPEVVKKYQYNKCELRALSWIDLSGCNKMHVNIGNHVTNPSLDEESSLKGLSGGIIIPGNRLPDWFNHRKESLNNDSREINIDVPLYLGKIRGIPFCAVIGPVVANPADWVPNIGVEIVGYGVQVVRFQLI
ncbi:TMV resistance protein N [Morella rubra]|uniref:TMV resistance protein N n=1 Tax=Morella rubra TaxID=262757 RepID=A0A6A1UYU6_9ROSI|nr:TMV resistance protein N [Morella rubra]